MLTEGVKRKKIRIHRLIMKTVDIHCAEVDRRGQEPAKKK